VNADQLDLLRFDELRAAAGEAVSAQEAERVLGQALGLWHGAPLRNVESPVLSSTAAIRLTDHYLDTCERWADLCLDMGWCDAVTARLTALVEGNPFRERLIGQLMVALYRSGRQADALGVYESLRRALAGDLGVDPGPAIQDLYLQILRADSALMAGPPGTGSGENEPGPADAGPGSPPMPPSAVPVPRQLPRDSPDFCGREGEVKSLADAITGSGAMLGEMRVAVISGPGGVGKTALAVHAAHRLAGVFGDGQLFADLNGVSGAPAQSAELLASFLRALGVAGPAIPRLLSDRITMYRSLAADRRLLIVLDNAASERQVRPLLPASASCAAIVTSRARLTGLAGTRSVHLDILDGACALDLLSRIIGRDRAAAEADDAAALAELCGGLPLALCIAGARLAARPHWPVAKLATRLADTRRGLNELVHGDLDVRASIALSYESLDDQAAQVMLRRVSLLNAPEVPAWAGAALLDVSVGEAEDICERLADAQLIDAGAPPGPAGLRYRLHDLVRAFARERAIAEEPDTVRTTALARAFGGWLALAESAHRCVYGGDFTILHGSALRWTGADSAVRQAIDADPIGWLEGERRAIGAAVQQSAELGLDELSWDLAWTAVTLYEARAYSDDRIAAQDYALAATERAGNRRGKAAMLAARSSCLLQMGRTEEALEPAAESLRLFTGMRDMHGCAIARYRLGMFHIRTGKPEAAVSVYQEGLRNAQLAGDSVLQVLLLRELALAHLEGGAYQAASDYATHSLRMLEETGNHQPKTRAMSLHVLAEVHRLCGDLDAAEGEFREVLVAVRAANDMVGQAHALLGLGETLAGARRHEEANQWLQEALTMARQCRQRTVEARALLLLGTLNPAQHPAPACRSLVSQSLAIFSELALPHWQQRASEALCSLDKPSP
jgi:tetratricopeptide (TPR) repeat protein